MSWSVKICFVCSFQEKVASVKDLEVIRDQRKTTEEKSSRDSGHDQYGSSHKCSHSRHVKDHPTSRCPRTTSEEKTDITNGGSQQWKENLSVMMYESKYFFSNFARLSAAPFLSRKPLFGLQTKIPNFILKNIGK